MARHQAREHYTRHAGRLDYQSSYYLHDQQHDTHTRHVVRAQLVTVVRTSEGSVAGCCIKGI